MADFIFPCSQCGQHIQYDDAYVGYQINCPTCQAAIIVPAAPAAKPAGKSGGGSGLRVALISLAVAVVCAGLGFGGWHFYSQHKTKQAAALGNPAALVAAPSAAAAAGAQDMMAKVLQAYGGLKSLSVEGTSLMVMDMSAITMADVNPQQTGDTKKSTARPTGIPKAMTNTTEVSIKLARPDLFRIEGKMKTQAGRMSMTNITAVWSPGKTNYALMMFGGGSFKNFMTVPERRSAFMMSAQAGGLAMATPQMFFGEAGDLGKIITDWGQTEDDSVNGQDCYTLTAKMIGQKLKIWVRKSSYLILKSQITLGGVISDADLEAAIDTFDTDTNKSPAQVAQEKKMAKQQAGMMAKIRGTITETYDNVEMNPTLAAEDFNYPVPRGVRLNAAPQFNGSRAANSNNSQRNACINNLSQLVAAKNEWALEKSKKVGDEATEADLKPYLKLDADGNLPKCPGGGKYTLGKVGENPTCSIAGHALP